ncbi:MAG: hypothetical protein C4297_12755 [Gemmataceae bacterium]
MGTGPVLSLRGAAQVPTSADKLRAWLDDLGRLVSLVPDVIAVDHLGPQQARMRVRPAFTFIRSELQVEIERLPVGDPATRAYRFHSSGIGSQASGRASLRLVSQGACTLLDWQLDIEALGGLLRALPRGLIEGAARQVVERFLARLHTVQSPPE